MEAPNFIDFRAAMQKISSDKALITRIISALLDQFDTLTEAKKKLGPTDDHTRRAKINEGIREINTILAILNYKR